MDRGGSGLLNSVLTRRVTRIIYRSVERWIKAKTNVMDKLKKIKYLCKSLTFLVQIPNISNKFMGFEVLVCTQQESCKLAMWIRNL